MELESILRTVYSCNYKSFFKSLVATNTVKYNQLILIFTNEYKVLLVTAIVRLKLSSLVTISGVELKFTSL